MDCNASPDVPEARILEGKIREIPSFAWEVEGASVPTGQM